MRVRWYLMLDCTTDEFMHDRAPTSIEDSLFIVSVRPCA